MPKARKPRVSEYSHTIYSNTRSGTKAKNQERHKRLQQQIREAREQSWTEEQRQRKQKRKKRNDGFTVV